jgi:uncharacterized protein YqjF (DUF2071 family)
VTATHPVAMAARFRELLVVTYAFPPAVLEPLVPASLALEQHDGHGFLAVALVDLDGLRPAALPRRLGVAARFAGYRILVRATTAGGRTRRGLKILHTDVNRRPLVAGMRLLTRYHASHARSGHPATGGRLPPRRARLHLDRRRGRAVVGSSRRWSSPARPSSPRTVSGRGCGPGAT